MNCYETRPLAGAKHKQHTKSFVAHSNIDFSTHLCYSYTMNNQEHGAIFPNTEADDMAAIEAEVAAANGAWDNYIDNSEQRNDVRNDGSQWIDAQRDYYTKKRDSKVRGFRKNDSST